jgi:type I restriction enzyme S subunit
VVLGDHVYALRFKENVNSKFIYYQINGRRINRQLRRMSNGTSQLGLGKKDVKIQKIFLPDKNEQNRIASILDNLKREIELLGQIKIYYKEQKRGLMQKLLTGEWRVGV